MGGGGGGGGGGGWRLQKSRYWQKAMNETERMAESVQTQQNRRNVPKL